MSEYDWTATAFDDSSDVCSVVFSTARGDREQRLKQEISNAFITTAVLNRLMIFQTEVVMEAERENHQKN